MLLPGPDCERDDRFEAYLREFRPLPSESFRMEKRGGRGLLRFALAAFAAAAFVLFIFARLTFYTRAGQPHSTPTVGVAPRAAPIVNARPFTLRSASALLATAPSFEAAVDEVALPVQAAPLQKYEHSALEMLGEEKMKL